MFLYILLVVILVPIAFVAYKFRKKLFGKKAKKSTIDAIIISGPAGVGKGTLIAKLQANHPGKFGFSVSHTTRAPRPGETNGKEYHFITREKFETMIANGEFIEHADVHGKLYGTSKAALDAVRKTGAVCIVEVDVQGATRLKAAAGKLNLYALFIKPPSFEALRSRMLARGSETPEKIELRLETAKKELNFIDGPDCSKVYDKVIVNDNLDDTYKLMERLGKLYWGM